MNCASASVVDAWHGLSRSHFFSACSRSPSTSASSSRSPPPPPAPVLPRRTPPPPPQRSSHPFYALPRSTPSRRHLPRPLFLLHLLLLQLLDVLPRHLQMLANLVRPRKRFLVHRRPHLGAIHHHPLQGDQLLHLQNRQHLHEQVL